MSEQDKPKTETYDGGFATVVAQMEGRRDPLIYHGKEALPPLDADLEAMCRNIILGEAPEVKGSRSSFAYKVRDLKQRFEGESELCYVNALLIANLRKREQPPHTAALFQRIWAEHADHLLERLNARWLVSSITTFGDHGMNDVQRRVGQNLTVLFNTMKLYETERTFSSLAPNRPYSWTKRRRDALPLDMDPYSVPSGGLDVNMLGRMWLDANEDPVLAPLATHLLELLNQDERGIFRRLKVMKLRHARTKRRQAAAKPAPIEDTGTVNIAPVAKLAKGTPRWGVVATIKAPLEDIKRFAAHHLSEGASRIYIYLDDPHPDQVLALSAHPNIDVTACDAAYWDAQSRPRMPTHQQRQVYNATQAYNRTDLDWLAHFDVDEFLLSPEPLAELLAKTSPQSAFVLLPPAEALAPVAGETAPMHFKLTARAAGLASDVLGTVYPTFGEHLRGGFISHLEGKVIARTGIKNARLGIHAFLFDGAPATNKSQLDQCFIGHMHAPDFDTFERHLPFRMSKGSYRKRDDDDFRLGDVITFLQEAEEPDALRRFFHEVCEATPELMDRLRAHKMLLTRDLALEAKARTEFGGATGQTDE